MSESSQRGTVLRALKGLHPVAIESRVAAGVPDVNYIEGWIELKWLAKWPAKADTPVRLRHFTEVQKHWLRKRWLMGGNAWLLLQCGREWLLFDGETAALEVGLLCREDLFAKAIWSCKNGLQRDQLVQFLKDANRE